MGTHRPLPTGEITHLLESGVEAHEIVRRMVATGHWSEPGAVDFVSFLVHGVSAPPESPTGAEEGDRGGRTASRSGQWRAL